MKEEAFQKLSSQLKSGNNQGLQDVFEETHSYCVRTLLKKTQCKREDAEDIYMDAVLIFRENVVADKLTHLTNLRTYLFGICLNLWRDHHRAQKKWSQTESEWERQFLMEADKQGLDLEEEKEMLKQRLTMVKKALKNLGEKCQTLIQYVYVEQRPHKEVALLMGLANANVVKVTRHRCYQQWIKQVEKVQMMQNGK